MLSIGQQVTRKGSSKVWEIAKIEAATVELIGAPESLIVKWYGELNAPVYTLKNSETGKVGNNVRYSADKLTAI